MHISIIMKRNSLILFVLFFAWFNLSLAKSNTDEFKNILSQTQSMQAAFEQFVITKSGVNQARHTTGKIMLIRPNKFRWETETPKQLIIVNNQQALIYDADLEQVTKQKINFSQPGNPAMLLSGSLDTLEEMFKIEQIPMKGIGDWFLLTPKIPNNNYQWVKLHFVNNEITAMYIMDNLGQQIEINFENIITNQKIPLSAFIFKIPKNADVIEN